MEFYPKPGQAKTVQIDIDPAAYWPALPGGCRPHWGLSGRAAGAVAPPACKQDRSFLETAQERMQQWREFLEERGTRTDVPMKPQVVTYRLNKLLAPDAIVSADSGTIATWAARYIDIVTTCSFRSPGP